MKREVDLGDRKVTIIGTAHISEESRNEVRQFIEEEKPDQVFVELDEDRLSSLKGDSRWKDIDVVEAIKEGKGYMLFLNLLLSIYQRNMGLEENIIPGEELLEAVDVAEENRIEYSLVDRNINDTLQRLRDELTIRDKLKLMTSLAAYPFLPEDEFDVEDLKEQDMITAMVAELEEDFPHMKKIFLDERNSYMAEKILEEDFEHGVAVVGAAHMEGLAEDLENQAEYNEEVKEKGLPWMKIANYAIPAAIISLISYAYISGGFERAGTALAIWILLNGLFSMIGAIAAKAHPLTWITSFIAAPLTSLSPVIGAGFVAAYIEAKLRPPSVEDMETIAEITDYKQLWDNQLGRIILTFILVSMGSALATFLSAGIIFTLLTWL